MTFVLSTEAELPSQFGSAQHEVAVEQAWRRHQQRIQQLLAKVNHTKFPLPQRDPVLAHWRLPRISLLFLVLQIRETTNQLTKSSTLLT